MQSCRQMFEGSRGDGSGRDEQNMAPSLSLLPCESSVSVKEDPDRIYIYIYIYMYVFHNQFFFCPTRLFSMPITSLSWSPDTYVVDFIA